MRDFSAVIPSRSSASSQLESNNTGASRRALARSVLLRKKASVWTTIAGSSVFQTLTLGVIVLNALWICVDVEWNHSRLDDDGDGEPPLGITAKVVENCFCSFFFVEVFIRFMAFETKRNCICDGWFVFDCVLVVLLVLETWVFEVLRALSGSEDSGVMGNFSSFRLLRLLRLTRMARIMRYFPELMTLVKGMITAASAVSWALAFLLLVMYIFAIFFTTQLGKPDKSSDDVDAVFMFASMGDSMMTLFTNGVLGDNLAQTIDAILEVPNSGVYLMWVFIAFLILCGITLMNLLIGVLCQVIENTAKEEEESMQSSQLKQAFTSAFNQMDGEQTAMVTEEDWEYIRQAPIVRQTVSALRDSAGRLIPEEELDHKLRQMQESVFAEVRSNKTQANARLSFVDFAEKVGELRTDAIACPLEVALIKQAVSHHARAVCKHLDAVEARLTRVLEKRKTARATRAAKGDTGAGSGCDFASTSACCGSGGGPGDADGGRAGSLGLQPLPVLEEVSLDQLDPSSPVGEASQLSDEVVTAGTSCSALQWRYTGDETHSASCAVIRCTSEAPVSAVTFLATVPTELLLYELRSRGPQGSVLDGTGGCGPAGPCSCGGDAPVAAAANSSAVLSIEDMGPVL